LADDVEMAVCDGVEAARVDGDEGHGGGLARGTRWDKARWSAAATLDTDLPCELGHMRKRETSGKST
jgi:hypothetical protein